jgi:glycosyltransferase involved in cell wall biosynthesis
MISHFGAIADRVPIIAISHAQRRSAPNLPIATVIHHGVNVDDFPCGTGRGDYLLFLGRMSPDKGVHHAIAVARKAHKPLLIAAKMWEPEERRYFAEHIEPQLDDDVVYLGSVGGSRKLDLLGQAIALVNPICWPEPFGLVMIEALACGTPVLAFNEGSVPEIVEHGRTGFICADEDDMVRCVGRLAEIDRLGCRTNVARRFSTKTFIARHLDLYRSLSPNHQNTWRDDALTAPPG